MADQPPVLSDGVITLRRLRPTDGDDIFLACQDPATVENTTIPHPYERAFADDFVNLEQSDEDWWANPRWAITAGDDRFGGAIDLRPDGQGAAEIGFNVAPWLRGQGVATRAVRLVCRWGFTTLGLQVISWHARVGNEASRGVALKAGFRVGSDVHRKALVIRGQRVDVWHGDLLPDDLTESGRRRRNAGPRLTPRERRILDLIAAGKSNRAIANELGISEHTVKNHVAAVLHKLSARSRMEAVVSGVRLGLTSVE